MHIETQYSVECIPGEYLPGVLSIAIATASLREIEGYVERREHGFSGNEIPRLVSRRMTMKRDHYGNLIEYCGRFFSTPTWNPVDIDD